MQQAAKRVPAAECGRMRRRSVRGWFHRLRIQWLYGRRLVWRRLLDDTPFGHLRLALTALLLLSGAALLAVLVVPQYDRALVLSGRTEVLAMHLDDAAFGILSFDRAVYRADPDTPPQQGKLQLDISPGTMIRFVRSGRGDVQLTFAAAAAAPEDPACGGGLRRIGLVSAGGAEAPLCEAALAVVSMKPGGSPLVVGLSGGIVVGEEVSEGAGPRPLLLQATASLLVKHGNAVFRWVCASDTLEHLCDRFVANSVELSPGDSVRAEGPPASAHATAGLGFIRIDPDEVQSGMLFNLAAPATAFQVQRMQGETFTVRESLFDVIERSPVVRTLNAVVIALGLVWYFLRLAAGGAGESGSGEGGRGAAALLLGALLLAPSLAQAQQALIRAEDTGQALLRSRGDRCYAVTPVHVLGGETSVLATAPGRQRGEGDLLSRIPAAPESVALITLRGLPLSVCPSFEGAVSLDMLLRSHTDATLRLVRADGSIDQLPLLLGSIEVETIEVRSAAGSLEQGMSGGTVLVANQPVGLLFDVTEEGHTGRVGRWDRISEHLAPYLANAIPAEAAHAPAGSVPYDIIRSNAAPVAPENKASSLQGDGPGPWRVSADGRVELLLKVSAPFSGVSLDLTALDDPPQSLEILAGRSAAGPWQSLASFALEPGDHVQERRFPPVALGFVLVRAYAPAARKTLAIGRFSLLPR